MNLPAGVKINTAQLQYTVIGFPGVVLKWHCVGGIYHRDPYLTVRDMIQLWNWKYERRECGPADLEREMERFEVYVRTRFGNDASVQG